MYAGHLRVLKQQNYEGGTMKGTPIARQLMACRHFALSTPRQVLWTLGAITLEGYARVQGYFDYRRNREHHIWQAVESTKDLEAGQRKVRRICNAQSSIGFRFIIEGAKNKDIHCEREKRAAPRTARKRLPYARSQM